MITPSADTPRCNCRMNGRIVFRRKQRPDGTSYTVRYNDGTECGEVAIVQRNGVRRCAQHIGVQ